MNKTYIHYRGLKGEVLVAWRRKDGFLKCYIKDHPVFGGWWRVEYEVEQ